jgi:hypothetical protein
MTPPRRKLIGTVSGLVTRQRVYRIENGLEMDDIDHFEITRKRVFFDDVVAMTWHQERGWLFIWLLGVVALIFLLTTFLTRDEPVVAAIFLALTLSFAIPVLFRLLMRIDVITVFGRRTRVRMKFAYRKGRAAQIFTELSAEVQAAQRRVAAEIAREMPAPPVNEPPLPPLPSSE